MTKLILTYILLVICASAFSQKNKASAALIGKWTVTKIEVTYPDKKVTQPIEDTSYYVFSSNMTYTLTCKDLWGNAKIVGKWKPDSTNKFELYDITHISEVKGSLPTYGSSYKIEIIKINRKPILYVNSYDKELDWLNEVYLRKDE